jgi:hypothetical protein
MPSTVVALLGRCATKKQTRRRKLTASQIVSADRARHPSFTSVAGASDPKAPAGTRVLLCGCNFPPSGVGRMAFLDDNTLRREESQSRSRRRSFTSGSLRRDFSPSQRDAALRGRFS